MAQSLAFLFLFVAHNELTTVQSSKQYSLLLLYLINMTIFIVPLESVERLDVA